MTTSLTPPGARRRPACAAPVRGLALVAAALLASCAARRATPLDGPIAFSEAKLREDPGLYAVRAELGEALLERARLTHDPRDVRRARQQLQRSMATQESFHAFRAMAALCNFTHRFEEALRWAERAEAAYPPDTGVTAQRVEALLALGRPAEAEETLARRGEREHDFFLTAAEGRLRAARGDLEGAAASFARAAAIAERHGAPSLVVWSNVSAAAVFIDSDRADEAAPYLGAAAAVDPEDPLLRIHRAEVLAAGGRPREALAVYRSLIAQYADPVLHAAASALHRDLGEEGEARRHFNAAEAGFRRAIDAGEVYTLESLARLYLAAGSRLGEARALAEQNLRYKRDADARRLLEEIDERIAAQGRHGGGRP